MVLVYFLHVAVPTHSHKGADLVVNQVSGAPGFWIGYVIVMAFTSRGATTAVWPGPVGHEARGLHVLDEGGEILGAGLAPLRRAHGLWMVMKRPSMIRTSVRALA